MQDAEEEESIQAQIYLATGERGELRKKKLSSHFPAPKETH